jgi:hypothetical protein
MTLLTESRGALRAYPLATLLLAAVLPGCGGAPATVPEGDVERAREAVAVFKGQLMRELLRGLEEGGAEGAIGVCSRRAPEIAAEQSTGGVRMGRTSHRLRNPVNAPKPWVEPILAAYAEGSETRPWVAVPLPEGRFGYAEPIRVMPPCLRCHGTQIDPEVRERIAALYPEDRAAGFEHGDFRGLFWVTMPMSEVSR